jgi:hypothetical protein
MNTQINSSIQNNTTNNTALAGQASFPVPVISLKQALDQINSTYDADTLGALAIQFKEQFFESCPSAYIACRDAICTALQKRLPTPELVTCLTDYGAAYGWKIAAAGLIAYGNTRLDCLLNFDRIHLDEYNRKYGRKSLSN